MNKLYLFFLGLILLSCNDSIICETFKKGHFLLKPNSTPDNYYFNVYRNDNEQIEIDSNGEKTSLSVNWINKCSFEIKSIPNSGNKFKVLNDSSVITIEIYKTVIDTAYYDTYVVNNNKKIKARSGKMIRVNNREIPPK